MHYPLSRFGQPRVIAEVIGGILLGPSVLSRIHGFRDAIFPALLVSVVSLVVVSLLTPAPAAEKWQPFAGAES